MFDQRAVWAENLSRIKNHKFSSSQMIKVTSIAAYKTYSCNIDKNASVLVTVSFSYNYTCINLPHYLSISKIDLFDFRFSLIWQKISECKEF